MFFALYKACYSNDGDRNDNQQRERLEAGVVAMAMIVHVLFHTTNITKLHA